MTRSCRLNNSRSTHPSLWLYDACKGLPSHQALHLMAQPRLARLLQQLQSSEQKVTAQQVVDGLHGGGATAVGHCGGGCAGAGRRSARRLRHDFGICD